MNPLTLKMALSAASSVWGRTKDYREQKSRDAYDTLAEAASTLGELKERSGGKLDESRLEAGALAKAARARLEKARGEVDDRRELAEGETAQAREAFAKTRRGLRKDASKKAKAAGKAAEKKAKKAQGKKRRGTLRKLGFFALIASLVGALYYWFTSRPERGTTPPKVQDFTKTEQDTTPQEPEPRLVYSTTTPGAEDTAADAEAAEAAKPAGDLAEDPAERDEELLGSLEEQLEAHRADNLIETPEEDTMISPDNAENVHTDADVDPEKTAAEAEAEVEEAVTAEAEETKGSEDVAKRGDLQAQGEELEDEFDRQIGRNPDDNRNQ